MAADLARRFPSRWRDAWVLYGGLLPLRHAAAGRLSWSRAVRAAWRARRFRFVGRVEADILFNVLVADEYGVGELRLGPDEAVIDVGGHVGCFGLVASLLGSRAIVSYEAHPRLVARLVRHYGAVPGARAVHAAVVGSDGARPARVDHAGYPPDGNTGGGSVVFDGRPYDFGTADFVQPVDPAHGVPARPLDSILAEYDEVALLKLDCEGAEYAILETSRLLARVRRIVAECHTLPAAAQARMRSWARPVGFAAGADGLAEHLGQLGFRVRLTPGAGSVLLSAEREA